MPSIRYTIILIFKWFGELNADELKKVPKIIVGNKIDMRNNEDPKHIKSEAVIISFPFSRQDKSSNRIAHISNVLH